MQALVARSEGKIQDFDSRHTLAHLAQIVDH